MLQDATLNEAQERAKTLKKGVWADDAFDHIRKVTWDVENTRELVERFKVSRGVRWLFSNSLIEHF